MIQRCVTSLKTAVHICHT